MVVMYHAVLPRRLRLEAADDGAVAQQALLRGGRCQRRLLSLRRRERPLTNTANTSSNPVRR